MRKVFTFFFWKNTTSYLRYVSSFNRNTRFERWSQKWKESKLKTQFRHYNTKVKYPFLCFRNYPIYWTSPRVFVVPKLEFKNLRFGHNNFYVTSLYWEDTTRFLYYKVNRKLSFTRLPLSVLDTFVKNSIPTSEIQTLPKNSFSAWESKMEHWGIKLFSEMFCIWD